MTTKQTNRTSSRKSKKVETVKGSAQKAQAKDQQKQNCEITHEQIAERAKAIWRDKGCPAGQDDANWREAEEQLKHECGIA
jgi:hypothetical protein